MARLGSSEPATRREKLFILTAVLASLLVHAMILMAGSLHLTIRSEDNQKRMLNVRRIGEKGKTPDDKPKKPTPQMHARIPPRPLPVKGLAPGPPAPAGGLNPGGGPRPGSGPKGEPARPVPGGIRDIIPAPPPPLPPDLEQIAKAKAEESALQGITTLTILTDLESSVFQISGPSTHKGTGTYWSKSNLAPGEYTVTFNPVDGYKTPDPRVQRLEKGKEVIFVGQYAKMSKVSVASNVAAPRFRIMRPDGKPLPVDAATGTYKDLPQGTYTIVFEDVPGFKAPKAMSKSIIPGDELSFAAFYSPDGTGKGGIGGGTGTGAGGTGPGGGGGRGFGYGAGGGTGTGIGNGTGAGGGTGGSGWGAGGSGAGAGAGTETARGEKALDWRVKVVVSSYPPSSIENGYGNIPYPEIAIKKSNFQQGWCQVYLVLTIDKNGRITDMAVERPKAEEQERFAPLIATVKNAVLDWDFDREAAEVHVDVRFYVER